MKIKVEIGDVYRFVGVSDEFHTHMSCYKVINVTEHKVIIGCNFTDGFILDIELLSKFFVQVIDPVDLMRNLFRSVS